MDVVVLITSVIIATLAVVYLSKLFIKKNAINENFAVAAAAESSSKTMQDLAAYFVFSLDEAKSIVDGTYDETAGTVWPISKAGMLTYYYSVFSKSSRPSLTTGVPFKWYSISSNNKKILASGAACSGAAAPVTFVKPPSPQIQDVYATGIPLHENRGEGPLAMDAGFNTSTAQQSFTMFMLVRFVPNMVQPTNSFQILNMKANTGNNNGLRVGLNVSNFYSPSQYRVTMSIQFGTSAPVTSRVPMEVNLQSYYLLAVTRSGNVVSCTTYLLQLDQPYIAAPAQPLNAQVTTTAVVEFSNSPILIGGGQNIVSILTLGMYSTGLEETDLLDLATYTKRMLLRTSPTSYSLCKLALSLTSCPYNTAVCGACPDITDWSEQSKIVSASTACRKAFTGYCSSNAYDRGCECWLPENANSLQCAGLRKLMQNTSSTSLCSVAELNDYASRSSAASAQAALKAYASFQSQQVKVKTFVQWLFGV